MPALGAPTRHGQIANRAIRESSGIVASTTRPGVFWTLNDSGNGPVLYAIGPKGGSLGRYRLRGAQNIDWEDIAADAGRLYVADIGDNMCARRRLTIYTLREPDLKHTGPVRLEAVRHFRYPRGHGPMDCEAMFVRAGWAYLISKEFLRARLYRVKLGGPGKEVVAAEYLGVLPGAAWVTAADISRDGRHVAVLSYSAAHVYDLAAPLEEALAGPATQVAKRLKAVLSRRRTKLVSLGQCEAICWVPAEPVRDLLVTNEERGIFRIRPVARATTASAPSP